MESISGWAIFLNDQGFWSAVKSGIESFSSFLWGYPLIIVLLFSGAYFTLRLFFVQIRDFWHAILSITGIFDRESDPGALTHFRALSTALSATIGTGNIAGVATAIAAGGPGAVFWMWVSGFFGMATKFFECTLATHFRRIDADGHILGGPMYYIELGLGRGWKWLAILFAVATAIAAFGIGNMIQSHSIADLLHSKLPWIPMVAVGFVIAVLVFLVIIGGVKRIGAVAARIVPFMAVIYVLGGLIVIFANIDRVGSAFGTIFTEAFSLKAGFGALLGTAVRYGLARGIFSNEAGLGSAPIAHAAARTKEPIREGLVAMVGPFVDTLVICTITALTIVITGAYRLVDPSTGKALDGAPLTAKAFEIGLPIYQVGSWIVVFGLLFFAFTTILGWSYYGEQALAYLLGRPAIVYYRWLWVLAVVIGSTFGLKFIWTIADISNGFMAFPNLVAVFLLSGVVVKLYQDYKGRLRQYGIKGITTQE